MPLHRLLPPLRRRPASRRWHWSHDDKRVILHRHGRLDPERVWLARIAIGNASWVHPFWGVFGDPTILLRYAPRYTARVIKFAERRSDLAKLRIEIDELQRTFRCAEAV
jgi:hypothetical protein